MPPFQFAHLVQTAGAILFAWMILRTLVDANHGGCSGWHEEALAGCDRSEAIPRDKRRRFLPKPWGHGIWHLLTAAASAVVFVAVPS